MKSSQIALTVLLTLGVTSTLGCKKKSSDSGSKPNETTLDYSKEVAALETKLKFVEGLKGALPPPTTKDGATVDPKLTFANWWVHDTDLGNVEAAPGEGLHVKDVNVIRECAKEARHPDFGKHSLDKLSRCERTRYALVVRTFARVAPKVTSEAKSLENGKFAKGTANGDVLVYDLQEKKQVGAYRWKAENGATVLDGKINGDLDKNILYAIEDGGRKFLK